tara:strand:+ start:64 stop:237 length:174 start_codon:yes stop_codon:yes gene_type:complete
MSKVFRDWFEETDRNSEEWLDFERMMEYNDYVFDKVIEPLLMQQLNLKEEKDESHNK